jgi:toluene monooxygenase electron transfer component
LTDCIIKVKQADSFIPIEPPRVRTATLRSIISLTHDMAAFTFESDGPADFLPGQYALLRKRDGQVERAYSMSNTRNEAGLWEFVIKQVPGGKFSTDIAAQLDISDGMVLDGPYGNAYLQVDSTRPVLCIAGGAGLSPMLSILRGAIRDNRFKERPLSLFYGARTPMDLCDATVLEDHVVLGQRVQWVNALSDAAPVGNKPWDGPTGFIHTVVAAQLANNLTNFEIYLSGPPPMTDAVQRMLLLDYRVPSQQIHFDRFY